VKNSRERSHLILFKGVVKWDNFALMNIPVIPRTSESSVRDRTIKVLVVLLRPVVRLALARGVKVQEFFELAKLSYLDEGKRVVAAAGHRVNVSTVSVATGLHRKEVTTMLEQPEVKIDPFPSLESRVFARWTTDSQYISKLGEPLMLPKVAQSDNGAPEVSFEALVRSLTTDVRPRAVLESMLRLGLVKVSKADEIILLSTEMVPMGLDGAKLEFLSDNLRDHLNAAVSNVLGAEKPFLEQSIYANHLTEASVDELHTQMRKRWLSLTQACVPDIQKAIDRDMVLSQSSDSKQSSPQELMRVRVGMYFYSEPQEKDGQA
jgi:Family of unknown function (DUF6502)